MIKKLKVNPFDKLRTRSEKFTCKFFRIYSASKVNTGFTLIEILIVVSIIGILLAVLTTSYNQAQKQGRDTKRRGDMRAVQTAFEQYKVANGIYPKTVDEAKVNFQDQKVPSDPLNRLSGTSDYTYKYAYDVTNGLTYCACALLENNGRGNSTLSDCTNFATGNYVCVKNLQ